MGRLIRFACFCILFLLSGCVDEHREHIYSDLIDELILRGELYPTPPTRQDEIRWGRAWEKYSKSHFNQDVYDHLQDSTLKVMKQSESRWRLLYAPEVRYAAEWKEAGESWVSEFEDSDFSKEHRADIVKALSSGASINYDSLNLPYLTVSPGIYNRNGRCILTFSQAYFNKAGDKALIYYEWCRFSEIILAAYAFGKWKIEKTSRVISDGY